MGVRACVFLYVCVYSLSPLCAWVVAAVAPRCVPCANDVHALWERPYREGKLVKRLAHSWELARLCASAASQAGNKRKGKERKGKERNVRVRHSQGREERKTPGIAAVVALTQVVNIRLQLREFGVAPTDGSQRLCEVATFFFVGGGEERERAWLDNSCEDGRTSVAFPSPPPNFCS